MRDSLLVAKVIVERLCLKDWGLGGYIWQAFGWMAVVPTQSVEMLKEVGNNAIAVHSSPKSGGVCHFVFGSSRFLSKYTWYLWCRS